MSAHPCILAASLVYERHKLLYPLLGNTCSCGSFLFVVLQLSQFFWISLWIEAFSFLLNGQWNHLSLRFLSENNDKTRPHQNRDPLQTCIFSSETSLSIWCISTSHRSLIWIHLISLNRPWCKEIVAVTLPLSLPTLRKYDNLAVYLCFSRCLRPGPYPDLLIFAHTFLRSQSCRDWRAAHLECNFQW